MNAFAQATTSNVLDMMKELRDCRRKITFLENQVNYYKTEKASNTALKACAFKVQDELNITQRIFYRKL